jgi:hypothetical protein
MSENEARAKLDELFELKADDSICTVFLASENARTKQTVYSHLNLSAKLELSFRHSAFSEFLSIATLATSGDLELRELNDDAKLDDFQIEWLDASDIPEVGQKIQSVPLGSTSVGMYDATDDQYARGLKYYVLVLTQTSGNRIILFRRFSAKNAVSRSRLVAVFSEGTYDRITQPTLLFDEQFDCIVNGPATFIRNKNDFQQLFGYHDKLRERALECLRQVKSLIPIANFDDFAASCQSHKQKLMKLSNILKLPHLQNVKIADMKKVIEQFKLAGVKIVEQNGEEQLVFDPADRWAILRLLNDDFLSSMMTSANYEVNSKRNV